MNFDLYQKMLTVDGASERDRAITRIHRNIKELAPANPAYHDVIINGEARHALVTSTLDTAIKNIVAMPGERLCVGNHVVYCDHDYWVTEASVDDGIYAYGKMTVCTDRVRFISPHDGSIVEYPIILVNATKFNTGETPYKRLTLQSGQFNMIIPIDEHTIKLDNGIRFLLDKRLDCPSAYRITYVDPSTYGYDDGLLNIVLLQCHFDPDTDNIDLMIADYYPAKKKDSDVDTNNIILDDKDLSIYIGQSKRFSPVCSEGTSNPLTFKISGMDNVMEHINYAATADYVDITVENTAKLIGNYIKLTISDADEQHEVSYMIAIKGLI